MCILKHEFEPFSGYDFNDLSSTLTKCHQTYEQNMSKKLDERLVKILNQKQNIIFNLFATLVSKIDLNGL